MYNKLMILTLHILIALSSLVFASYVLAKPSQIKLYVNYGLIAATATSGTYLLFTANSHLLAACASGLIYLTIASCLSLVARHKLSLQNT